MGWRGRLSNKFNGREREGERMMEAKDTT